MPRVKAYKGLRGHIIPLDEAKVATAYRCPWTARVFGTKKGYVNHLKVLREDRIHRAIRARIAQRKRQDLWHQPSFSAIIDWIATNPEFMFDQTMQNGWSQGRGYEKFRDKFWIKITYLKLVYSKNASNSHDCPRDGVRNWGGRGKDREGNPLPTGYPGWIGNIEYQTSHDVGFSCSRVLELLGIYTGSGGGITQNRNGYSLTMFESDWPGLAEANTMARLKGESIAEYRYGEPIYFR